MVDAKFTRRFLKKQPVKTLTLLEQIVVMLRCYEPCYARNMAKLLISLGFSVHVTCYAIFRISLAEKFWAVQQMRSPPLNLYYEILLYVPSIFTCLLLYVTFYFSLYNQQLSVLRFFQFS